MTDLMWKVSNWDHKVHGFRTLGEVASEAICTHSALTKKLTDNDGSHRWCHACQLIHGDELAAKLGDAGQWT